MLATRRRGNMGEEQKYTAPYNTYRALASKVLVVVTPGNINDWAAYCDAVPGISHRYEHEAVARHGAKLPKDIAVAMFPQFDPAMYRSH